MRWLLGVLLIVPIQAHTPGKQRSSAKPAYTAAAGSYTIGNQQPITDVIYPNGLLTKPLPNSGSSCIPIRGGCGPLDHLYNGCAIGNECSDTVAQNVLTGGNPGKTFPLGSPNLWIYRYGRSSLSGPTFHYGSASDPVYKVVASEHDAPPPYNAVGKLFHIPNGSTIPGTDDKVFCIWNQTGSSDPDNDQLLCMFWGTNRRATAISGCSPGQGAHSNPCPLTIAGTTTMYYTEATKYHDPANPGYTTLSGPWSSIGVANWGGGMRVQEMIQGKYHHALLVDVTCNNGKYGFPRSCMGCTQHVCRNPVNRPPSAALFFLDYTEAQLADIKSKMTPKQQAYEYPIIEALTHYGGYNTDTQGDEGYAGIALARFESEGAYHDANLTDPIFAWVQHQADGAGLKYAAGTGGSSVLSFTYNVPLETGPNCPTVACTIDRHLHIADPCIARGLAGIAGGCASHPVPRHGRRQRHSRNH
jgi:hypothetical protein